MSQRNFNVRVYGLLLHGDLVLVSDERIGHTSITKFPGGGLEFGEGLKDCLVREIQEEIGVEAFGLEHFYTTDLFQLSAFRAGEQIISIYYLFQVAEPEKIPVSEEVFDFLPKAGDQERFRWLDLRSARSEDATLPIDRVVLGMLIARR